MPIERDVHFSELNRLACDLWTHLPSQLTVGLVGTLGAGKTTFAKALATAIGVDSADITSPTFTLHQSYEGMLPTRNGVAPTRILNHLDAYRVADEDEFLELGVEELFEQDAWTVIEWADRVAAVLPDDTLWIRIDLSDIDTKRRWAIESNDQRIESMLASLPAPNHL